MPVQRAPAVVVLLVDVACVGVYREVVHGVMVPVRPVVDAAVMKTPVVLAVPMHDLSRHNEVHVESTPVVADVTEGVLPSTITVCEPPAVVVPSTITVCELPAVVVLPLIAVRLITV